MDEMVYSTHEFLFSIKPDDDSQLIHFFCVWHQKTINSNNFNHFSLGERKINKKN